jgi:hypothetical protein
MFQTEINTGASFVPLGKFLSARTLKKGVAALLPFAMSGASLTVLGCCTANSNQPLAAAPVNSTTCASTWAAANASATNANLQAVLTTCGITGKPVLFTGELQKYGRGDGNTLPGYFFAYYNNADGTQQLYLYRAQAYINQLGQTKLADGYPPVKIDGVAVTSTGTRLIAFDETNDGASGAGTFTFLPTMPALIPSPDFLALAQSLSNQVGGTFNYAPANGESAAVQLSDVTVGWEASQQQTANLNATLNKLSGTNYFTATKWIDYSTRDSVNTSNGPYWTNDPTSFTGYSATTPCNGAQVDPCIPGTGWFYHEIVSGTQREYLAFHLTGDGYMDAVKAFSYAIGGAIQNPSAAGEAAAKALAVAAGLSTVTIGTTPQPAFVSVTVTADAETLETQSAAVGDTVQPVTSPEAPTAVAPATDAAPAAVPPGPLSLSVTPRLTLRGAREGLSFAMTMDKNGVSASEMTVSLNGGGAVVRMFGNMSPPPALAA